MSDYCRRAKASAPASEVRDALSLLAETDDFRVRDLTDGEPAASPLGPYALVDILSGTAPALAAQRQACGFYEVVAELARVREEKTPLAPPPAPAVPSFAPPPAPRPASRKDAERAPAETVAERIAPRKRAPAAGEQAEDAASAVAEEPVFLKRELPKPRGRFSQLSAPRHGYNELMRVEGKALLEAATAQHEHRLALHKALAEQYNGPRGDLTMLDLEAALTHHGLLEAYARSERERVLSAYGDQRGAAGRVAWALGLSPTELQQLLKALDIVQESETVRERFRREALASRNLTQRLDLLGREKYLHDLGIQRRFAEALKADLHALLRDEAPQVSTLSELADRVARHQGAPTELLLRAIERLKLAEPLKGRLAGARSRPSHEV
ncbi:hypothetical protein [Aggregicoccus sp. 17bor-14]|uniref:hypothetical protein n=1 Tax=Myxococcaceae TaxID=31 RepID=UPI00351A86B4